MDIASAAAAYVQRGWKVIQLHDVTAGACSCQLGQYCDSAGKHPIASAWQLNYLSTAPEVYEAWARRPQAGVGVITGPASGVWVLDIDPGHGGADSLATLETEHGPMPKTYTVRTGSGGTHLYFALTNVDFDLTNSTGGRGRFPAGLDVRGRGGFVVAPPSVSGRGAYVAMADPDLPHLVGPVAEAPIWAVERQRPKPYVRPEITPGADMHDGHAYALAAVRGVLEEMASAAPGTRNETAFRVGTRLYELAIAPWARLDFQQIEQGFLEACAAANVDGNFLDGEAWSVWLRVQRRQEAKPADPPKRDPNAGTVVDWVDRIPWPASGAGGASGFGDAGQAPAADAQDLYERDVLLEMHRQGVRAEAQRRLRAISDRAEPIEILDRAAQRALPRVEPLVAGWLGRRQAARIYGPPGAGKSFAAVDLAACIAAGRPWHGRAVQGGEVLYIASEDAEGVALRVAAWERHYNTEHNVHMVTAPLRLDVDTVKRIMAAVLGYFGERELALIVVDTQAMVTVGMDENSAAEMGLFIQAVKLLAAASGAAVLVVHHSGVRGGRARGSSAVLGAMDVEIEASMAGTTMTLTGGKQKNIAKPAPMMLNLHQVDMGEIDSLGSPITSCVLLGSEDVMGPFVSPAGPVLGHLQRRAMAIATVLAETDASGETYARTRVRACAVTSFGVTPASVTSSFSKAWAYLIERGRIAKSQGREAYYFIELDGLDRLARNPDKMVAGGPEVYNPSDHHQLTVDEP